MVWKTSYNSGLGQPVVTLGGVDTIQRVALGTILRAFDDVMGEGEFIYLPGITSANGGDVIHYDLTPGNAVLGRATSNTQNNSGWPIAVTNVNVPTGSFGWYQITGVAAVTALAGTVAGRTYIAAGSFGTITSTAVAGAQLLGARTLTAVGTPAAGQSYVYLSRPCYQGQIT